MMRPRSSGGAKRRLARQFGTAYHERCVNVGRWLPRFHERTDKGAGMTSKWRKIPFLRWSFLRLLLGMKHLTTEWQVGDGREARPADYVVAGPARGVDDPGGPQTRATPAGWAALEIL